jgi:hypothetical protein
MKRAAVPNLVIAILKGGTRLRQQGGEPALTLDQRPRAEIFAVEIEKIEQEEHACRPRWTRSPGR